MALCHLSFFVVCREEARTVGSDNPSSERRAVLARAMPSRDGLKTSVAKSVLLPLLKKRDGFMSSLFFCCL